MDNKGPYRSDNTLKSYAKTLMTDNTTGYVACCRLMTEFKNRLLFVGVKHTDISEYITPELFYYGKRQYTRTFFTVTYFFNREIF